jgi:hypothetical protein
MRTFSVVLDSPAGEMAQEETQKQLAYMAKGIRNVRFVDAGRRLLFEAPESADGGVLARKAEALVVTVQRGLRSLKRSVVHRSATVETPTFSFAPDLSGIHSTGPGQVALEGLPLKLLRYFDTLFESLGAPWHPRALRTPTLISANILARCDYFRSFPHSVTFACHLSEDSDQIDRFRQRHESRRSLDDESLADMQPPQTCLSPAVCYHVYALNSGRVLPAEELVYAVWGKCFRYESTNLRDLRRLWDFTMREIVFLGRREAVLAARDRAVDLVADVLATHRLAGEIRTASDPFFVAPDAVAKTYFQLSSETKYEVSLLLPDHERLAVSSLNYHTDFFGRAFDVSLEGGGAMHSVCVGFGLERWVYAFLAQHGSRSSEWPDVVRGAPEFADDVP